MSKNYKKRTKSTSKKTYKQYSTDYKKMKDKGIDLEPKLTKSEFNTRYNDILQSKKANPYRTLLNSQKKVTYEKYEKWIDTQIKKGYQMRYEDKMTKKSFEEQWGRFRNNNEYKYAGARTIWKEIQGREFKTSAAQAEKLALASQIMYERGKLTRDYTADEIRKLSNQVLFDPTDPNSKSLLLYIGEFLNKDKYTNNIYGGHYE